VELLKDILHALRLGRLKKRGALLSEHVSIGKFNNVNESLEIARAARPILVPTASLWNIRPFAT
jgi:glutaryl-CoA dehydrogenase